MISNYYRVTKYNPANRDRWGAYLVDEWTTPIEIGEEIGGHVLTEAEFEETVNKYLYALEAFAVESGATELTLRRLVVPPELLARWGHLSDADRVSLDVVMTLARMMLLGEDLLVFFEDDDFFVHIGYDMYMWIGSHVDCVKATAEAQRIGLFVEPGIVSPDLKAPPTR